MKRIVCLILGLFLLCASGCAGRSPAETDAAEAWPTHAPGATPYVKLHHEPAAPEPETDETVSREEFLHSLYVFDGNFYFKDWEKQMFEELPQDEDFAFVVHTDLFLSGGGVQEDYIALARAFADRGCAAEVREMDAVQDGARTVAYVVVIRTTPAHLWELADEMEQRIFVEQLYESVDLRFDRRVWPEEG